MTHDKTNTTDEPTQRELESITDEELSGPRIDRRTSLKLLSAAGMAAVAGCASSEVDQSSSDIESGDGGDDDSMGDDSSSTEAEVSMGGTLQAGWMLPNMDELDPPYINHTDNMAAMINIFDALVKIGPEGGIVGNLATDWTVDGTNMTFQLRDDVTFHNGESFTAEDVRYTISRTINEELPAASAISKLQAPDDGGVVVNGDYEVELNWTERYAPAMAYLTRRGRAATVVNKTAIEEMGGDYGLEPVGTGPFKVTGHVIQESVTLEAFDEYHETDANGNSLPYLDGVEISLVPEPSTATSAIRSGDLDFLQTVPPQSYEQVANNDGISANSQPLNAWRGLEMNQTKEPFSSKKFRQGIAKLIDSERFVNEALFGLGQPAVGPLSPDYWPERDDKPQFQAYAPEEGKELIRESGYEGAEFNVMGRPGELRWARVLSTMLNESGVVNAKVNQVTGSQSSELILNLEYDTWVGGGGAQIDPDGCLYNYFTPDGIWNWTGYGVEETTNLLNQQRQEMDKDARGELIKEVEDKIMKDTPHAFLFHAAGTIAMQSSVKGFVQVPGLRAFHSTWLDR